MVFGTSHGSDECDAQQELHREPYRCRLLVSHSFLAVFVCSVVDGYNSLPEPSSFFGAELQQWPKEEMGRNVRLSCRLQIYRTALEVMSQRKLLSQAP